MLYGVSETNVSHENSEIIATCVQISHSCIIMVCKFVRSNTNIPKNTCLLLFSARYSLEVLKGEEVVIEKVPSHLMRFISGPPIKGTPNKEHLSIKDKSTHPSSYYTSTF